MTRMEPCSISDLEPVPWKDRTLRDLVSLQRGHDLTWRDRRRGEVPVMGSAGQNGFHDTALANGPGLVLGRSGASFGQAHFCEEPFWPHNTALYATDFHGNEPLFVFYRLTLIDFSRHNTGGAQQSLNRNFIYPIPVRIPSPEEQKAIAAALSDVDALLGALDRLIAKKRDLKQAAMQQLLTGQTRLPGFSGKWETKLVRQLGEVVTGGTPPTEVRAHWDGSFPWVTPTDISGTRDISATQRQISSSGLRCVRPLPANSVLVTCIASIGKNAILRRAGACNQQINAVVPNASHSPEFLYYSFEAGKQYLLANAGTTATSIISKKDFSELSFPMPELPEQNAIAGILSDMDAELTALEQRRDKTRLLKQGMMQELLTGRTRLV
ncbi:MAG: restriction endonuclease subunit S [Dokdonella sp.]|nr:MAG: restriction endonuclease subunit S [Dokdonella sp.]